MIEGYSIRQLKQQSRHSVSKLRLIINRCLINYVPDQKHNYYYSKYLVFDGTYIYKRFINVVALMDSTINKLIKGAYDLRENSLPQLLTFFSSLKESGLNPISCTVDGNPHVIRTLKTTWPDIIIQRCLVHIQRQGLAWCRINPKSTSAKKLRILFQQVTKIHDLNDKMLFIKELQAWEIKYGSKLAKTPEHGWVLSDLKRARSMLIKALPNMFFYLDNQNIPSTTNLIEGYFSILKGRYRNHRGLSPKKRRQYFNWYFLLRP